MSHRPSPRPAKSLRLPSPGGGAAAPERPSGRGAARCLVWLLAALLTGTAVIPAAAAARRIEEEGVAVEMDILPAAETNAGEPTAGEAARIRFTITDTTTGEPLRRLNPAAWLSRHQPLNVAQPRTCTEKVQELLGGSIFSRAELDLNAFHVLALNDDATITVVDPLFGFGGTKLLAMVPLPGVGSDWELTPDGRRLWVTVPATNQVAIVDTAAWQVTATLALDFAPGRIALQPDSHYAWAGAEDGTGGDGVAVLATDRPELVRRLVTGRGPHALAFSADSRWAFVVNRGEGTLSVVDVRTLRVAKTENFGGRLSAPAYSRLGETVYITDEDSGAIIVYDAQRHEEVARMAAEPGVGEVRLAPGDRYGLVANPARDLVLVFDTATNRLVQRGRIEHAPEQFAFTGDLAFVRRRGTASVGMIPLKELGREGQPLPVAEFTGGEAPFGMRTSPADSIAQASGESAVVVANPQDKAIYYYMPGMAAPMGNFGNYDRKPRAVRVLDRSLREVRPGVYETSATMPAPGAYDTVFFLNTPRIAHCFETHVAVPPAPLAGAGSPVSFAPVASPAPVAGKTARVAFHLNGVPSAPADLGFRVMLASGAWHRRPPVVPSADGTVGFDFTPPRAGLYYVFAEAASIGLTLNRAPILILEAAASATTSTP